MKKDYLKKIKMPDSPGVYFFLNRLNKVLYIGRATSLRSRVKSYFSNDLSLTRGKKILNMVEEATKIKYKKTESVFEAILLEADLIKKFKPEFNTADRDDKSFNCVVVTKDPFPRVLLMRKHEVDTKLKNGEFNSDDVYGPFPEGAKLKEVMKIIRKIFPFSDKCVPNDLGMGKPCFNRQIGLCPGVCTGEITRNEYGKIIKHIKLLFQGRKKLLLKSLTKQMAVLAKNLQFEKAALIKRQISALKSINDVALISKDTRLFNSSSRRIEAYDVAHLAGSAPIGVMVTLYGEVPDKTMYRTFRLSSLHKGSDTSALEELLLRRFKHEEWGLPDLVVIDGGKAQMNVAVRIIKKFYVDKNPDVVAVTKDEYHRPKNIEGDTEVIRQYESAILLANSEAHRFATNRHRRLLSKSFVKGQ
jgi:excinuclease ABC subunit C